jgi:hypothetical protein
MALTKVIQSMIDGFEARTSVQLNTGPDPTYPGAYGPDPSQQGLQFWANDTAGNRKVFASIQTEIQDATAGAVEGRLHFLVNDGNFLQVIGTVNRDGSWILGPGSGSYIMQICGEQNIGFGVPTPPVAVFGERVSAIDPDYEDCRALAIRNTKITDLTSLAYRAGMGFSILNSTGKERPTGHLRFQYSDRTANTEDSYMYPTTLVNGVQIDGPYFHNDGIGFELNGGALLAANTLDDYEEGTWIPAFGGSTSNPSQTIVQALGRYTKIGRLVTFYGVIQQSAFTGGSGDLRLTGLPFTSENFSFGGQLVFGFQSVFAAAPRAGITNNNTFFELYKSDNASFITGSVYPAVVVGDVNNVGGYINFSGFYYAAS